MGVLLINLGTPDSPSVRDVRRYLREFLSDPRVLTLSPLGRWLLLNLVILPTRPRQTARAYAQIWREEGSPLLLNCRALCGAVAERLGSGYQTELAMRYAEPNIGSALERLQHAGAKKVFVLPLFPQYAEAATGSAVARVEEETRRLGNPFELVVHGDFYDDPGFIEAQAECIRSLLTARQWDHVLFSYHGLPEAQLKSIAGCLSDEKCCDEDGALGRRCYRAQCFGTTRALSDALGLEAGGYSSSFQSRLTREPWILPYTDHVLPELYADGKRRLLVVCPAFTADNLETLEEVGIRLRKQWKELGGDDFALASCVNDSPRFVRAISDWAREHAESGRTDASAPD
jgi:ferrochelatase